MVKNSPVNAGDKASVSGLGRSPGGRNGNPLQYSYLENPMDRGSWQATVHGVTKSQTRLNDFLFTRSGKPLLLLLLLLSRFSRVRLCATP